MEVECRHCSVLIGKEFSCHEGDETDSVEPAYGRDRNIEDGGVTGETQNVSRHLMRLQLCCHF